jgi:hypothetical protein
MALMRSMFRAAGVLMVVAALAMWLVAVPVAGAHGDQGPPDHAGEQGPPDHAGEQGPPDHANAPDDAGPPDHAGEQGPPDHAGEQGPPDHAGEQGPPDHSNAPEGAGPPDHAAEDAPEPTENGGDEVDDERGEPNRGTVKVREGLISFDGSPHHEPHIGDTVGVSANVPRLPPLSLSAPAISRIEVL